MATNYRYVKNEKGEFESDPRTFSLIENIMGISAMIACIVIPIAGIEDIWFNVWPTGKIIGTCLIVIMSVFTIFRITMFDAVTEDGKKRLEWKERYRLVEEYDDGK
jgi:hypothetical protein